MTGVTEGEEGVTKDNAAPSMNQRKMKEDEITTQALIKVRKLLGE